MPKNYLTVREVAQIMGVTPLTVRNWDRRGLLTAFRHPLNNYRLYKISDVEMLLKKVERVEHHSSTTPATVKKLKIEME